MTSDTEATASSPTDPRQWWRGDVTYQVYIRSFADSDANGLGDVNGIRTHLPYLADLGVDAIWINPWYPSPQADAGYDVADYRDIDPGLGTLGQAEAMIHEAHTLGLRVLLDVVPNHTSDEHPWFVAALKAGHGSPERELYHFRDGSGADGAEPPNNWQSVFGGSAWHRITEADGSPGQWYLHLFDTKQPDLNWENPRVRAEFEDILRFWFDRGADGFRIDVAHGLSKDPDLRDLAPAEVETELLGAVGRTGHPFWDRDDVHEIYRDWRRVAQEYDPERIFVAEVWVADQVRLAAYLRPDELHTAFDFDFVIAPWNAEALRRTASSSLAAHDAVGAPVMWVLSNHDITRHVTRLGRPEARTSADPLHGKAYGKADLTLGRRRARAALLLELALPGGVYLYQGEELGLEEVEDLPEDLLQDPIWTRSGHTERGRDGCRVPLPWNDSAPSLGFSDGPGWLPQPPAWAELCVQQQDRDPASMLTFYRTALRLRRELSAVGALGAGDRQALRWLDLDGDDVLAFQRLVDGTAVLACVVNTGPEPVALPVEVAAGKLLLASSDDALTDTGQGERLAGDSAVWLRLV